MMICRRTGSYGAYLPYIGRQVYVVRTWSKNGREGRAIPCDMRETTPVKFWPQNIACAVFRTLQLRVDPTCTTLSSICSFN
jgi:hypothetical protein